MPQLLFPSYFQLFLYEEESFLSLTNNDDNQTKETLKMALLQMMMMIVDHGI